VIAQCAIGWSRVTRCCKPGPCAGGLYTLSVGCDATFNAPVGCEHTQDSGGKQRASGQRGTPNGTVGGGPSPKTPPADPDLAAVVMAWPDLPAALRAGIVAMVKAAKGGQ
jgi:hypothetical protein